MTSTTTTIIDWQGITLSVTYEPSWLGVARAPDRAVAHLQVQAINPERAPLPITETGYRSCFLHPSHVEAAGGPVPFVIGWLDAEAASPQWRDHSDRFRQLSLF